jgi:hypothetical protein
VIVAALPVVVQDTTYHVGTLNFAARKASSYEGDGLSVSVHPDDWARIARLSDQVGPLSRRDGNPFRFLDAHSITDPDRAAINGWGVDQGWLEPAVLWAVQNFDEDDEPAGHFLFATEDEARWEAEAADGEEPYRDVWAVETFTATAAFPAARVLREQPGDVLLTVYVGRCRPDLDGVWWEDIHNPLRLSCPRGVLVRGTAGLSISA